LRAFTLVEILIVIVLYTLVLGLVIPRFTDRTTDVLETLEKIILIAAEYSKKKNEKVFLWAKNGRIQTSYGKVYNIDRVIEGFCILKPIAKPYYCYFTLNTRENITFTPLGKFLVRGKRS